MMLQIKSSGAAASRKRIRNWQTRDTCGRLQAVFGQRAPGSHPQRPSARYPLSKHRRCAVEGPAWGLIDEQLKALLR
jgi:hypothetical protein